MAKPLSSIPRNVILAVLGLSAASTGEGRVARPTAEPSKTDAAARSSGATKSAPIARRRFPAAVKVAQDTRCVFREGTGLPSFEDDDGKLWQLLGPRYNLECFGPIGATDDTDTVQDAIDAVAAAGGGTILIPAFLRVRSVNIGKNITLEGLGSSSSGFISNVTGDVLATRSPLNASTEINVTIKNLMIKNENRDNTGGCYVDVGGSFIHLEDVNIYGCKYGRIYDQSEMVSESRVKHARQLVAGGWIVGNSDHSPGLTFVSSLSTGARAAMLSEPWSGPSGTYNIAFTSISDGKQLLHEANLMHKSAIILLEKPLDKDVSRETLAANGGFTNVLNFTNNNGNLGNDVYHLIDDGGYSHNWIGGNFNGGAGFRVAGVISGSWTNTYMESASKEFFFFSHRAISGNIVGQSQAISIKGSMLSPANGLPAIRAESLQSISVSENVFAGNAPHKIIGAGNIYACWSFANVIANGDLFQGKCTSMSARSQ